MGKKLTTAEFISKAKLFHNNKYDYSKVKYIDRRTKVIITCPYHGDFEQSHDIHFRTKGCPKCGILSRASKQRLGTEQFISEARLVHGDKYDYSKVNYINSETKVCIICPTHGETYQSPFNHLHSCGCIKCYHDKLKSLVCGIGVNDVSDCPKHIYQKWISMIKRCYSIKSLQRQPTYQKCSVCSEWLKLSNFKSWFEDNYIEGYDLDKDLLSRNDKVYSPETCCFLPKNINIIISSCSGKKGRYEAGISTYRHNKYIVSICKYNKKIHLGCFDTQVEAANAYKSAKEQYVKELAERYFQEGKITERVYNALLKFTINIDG